MNISCQHELSTQNLNEYFLPTCTYPCWTMQDHAGPCHAPVVEVNLISMWCYTPLVEVNQSTGLGLLDHDLGIE